MACVDAAEGVEGLPGPLGAKYDDKEESLVVTLAFPGIKKPPFFGLFGGGNSSVIVTAKEESLRVYVEILVKKRRGAGKEDKVDKFVWLVKKLPEKILPDDLSWKVRDNQIILTLKKAVPGSWQRTLDQFGIDISDV